MGSAVQSSPLTSTLTMRAFLTVFLAVAVCGEADPYTIGQVLAGRTAGGVITGVSYPGVGAVAGFPYTAVPILDIPTPWSTERGRLRLSLSLTPSDRSLPDITLLTLLPREEHTMLESLLTPLSLPLSTMVW